MPADQTLPAAEEVQDGLLDLAHVRLAELLNGEAQSTLDDLVRRLFDPQEREHLTVSAFSSAL